MLNLNNENLMPKLNDIKLFNINNFYCDIEAKFNVLGFHSATASYPLGKIIKQKTETTLERYSYYVDEYFYKNDTSKTVLKLTFDKVLTDKDKYKESPDELYISSIISTSVNLIALLNSYFYRLVSVFKISINTKYGKEIEQEFQKNKDFKIEIFGNKVFLFLVLDISEYYSE